MAEKLPATSVAEHLAASIAALRADNKLPPALQEKCVELLIDVVGLCVTARNEDYIKSALAGCDDLGALMRTAEQLCLAGHGTHVTFSKKVFIPLTKLCRDVCHYCTFAHAPRESEAHYLSPEAVRISESVSRNGQHPYGDRFRYLTSTGSALDLPDASVDVFFAGESIEHVFNVDAFLDEVYRVLRPGGRFIVTTPNAAFG